jgi:HK97 family phage prohead protease
MLWRETKRAEAPLGRTSEAGTIEGYASLFGVADTGGDIVMAGAFARSLARRGAAGVKMLWQHKAAEPIGVWTALMEDARGLKAVGRLDLDVARAREALSLMKTGAIDGLSIGFRAQRADRDRKSGLRRLHEIDLWEISIVTFPMLPAARVDKIKRRAAVGAATGVALARLQARQAAWDFQRKLHQLRRD